MSTDTKQGAGKSQRLARGKGQREYLYRQLSVLLREDIRKGTYPPGARLPSLNEIKTRHHVNKITVLKALAELRDQGLIYSVAAQGTYVSEASPRFERPASKGTLSVGLVSHVLYPGGFGPYHVDLIAGIQEELRKEEANLVVLPTGLIEPQNKIYDLVMKAHMDAIVYLGTFQEAPLRRMIHDGPPAVLVDFALPGEDVDMIRVDNRAGAAEAVNYLLSMGHRRLAMILGPDDQIAARERLAGARQALKRAGIAPSSVPVAQGRFNCEQGAKAMKSLLAVNPRPTAVFCLSDEMAAGALQTLHTRSSLVIPRDLSVIGFDDVSWATTTHPPLTTIRVNAFQMGRLAVQRLMERLKDPNHTVSTTVVSPRLVVRASTASPPHES